MIDRRRTARPALSSLRSPVSMAIPLFAIVSLALAACGGDGGGGDGGGSGGSTSTTTGTTTGTGTTTTTGNAQVILSCGDNLPYVASCQVDGGTYTACSDFFGNQIMSALSAQCAAGNGTFGTTPCAVQDRAGACVFFNAALPDRCYVEHIAPPSAADFWSMTCPQAGGEWKAAQ